MIGISCAVTHLGFWLRCPTGKTEAAAGGDRAGGGVGMGARALFVGLERGPWWEDPRGRLEWGTALGCLEVNNLASCLLSPATV